MKDRPIAIDEYYPPINSYPAQMREDLRAFYKAEREHTGKARFFRMVLGTAAGVLIGYGLFVGIALFWYYGPQIYVECQKLRQVMGSAWR